MFSPAMKFPSWCSHPLLAKRTKIKSGEWAHANILPAGTMLRGAPEARALAGEHDGKLISGRPPASPMRLDDESPLSPDKTGRFGKMECQ
jgi:hypothetical protein